MTEQKPTYSYAYSAAQQAEIKAIRQKYLPMEEDKMTQLRRLDAGTTRKGACTALTVGTLSALVMGLGMSCCLVWGGAWFVPGIALGLAGMGGAALAYPLYTRITQQEREKVADQILQLTDELMK